MADSPKNKLIERWQKRSSDYERRADKAYGEGDEDGQAETYLLLGDAYRLCATELAHTQI